MDAPITFSRVAKIEYLTGLALSGPPGSERVDQAVTNKAMRLTAEVFEAVHAKLFLKSVEETPPTDPAIYRTSYLMQLEHLLHRMGGYAIHLEEINDEVFEPHRDLYLEALGFCPSDAVRLVRRHTVWLNRELELARKEFLALRNARATMGLDLPFSVARRVHTVLEAAYRWKADDLAKATSSYMPGRGPARSDGCDFGTQPAFRFPYATTSCGPDHSSA